MNDIKKIKTISALLAALVFWASIFAVADDSMVVETPLPEAPAVAEQQPPSNSSPEKSVPEPAPETAIPQEDSQPLQEPEQPTQDIAAEATPQALPKDAVEPPVKPTPEPAEEFTPEEVEALQLSCAVRWVIDTADALLHIGDEITLQAEVTPDADGMQFQWQVAKKMPEKLQENEPEWADVTGERGLEYTFAVEEGMQTWRWRLLVNLPGGEVMFSDEMMLPPITAADEPQAPAEAVLGIQDADDLTTASITFTASVPVGEITYGTRIELVAEIDNPREGMLLQWQYMPEEEETWQDAPGANETAHAYVLDEENAGWLWRLLITVPEASDNVVDGVIAEDEATTIEDVTLSMEGMVIF